MDIRVLWIDDQPNESFIDRGDTKYGLYIENRMTVDEGIEELLRPDVSYDAIILDARGLCHKNDNVKDPRLPALNYAIRKIEDNKIAIPWFVYSAGGEDGEATICHTVSSYEKPYHDKLWYRKTNSEDREALFVKIQEVVSNMDDFHLKEKYSDIFEWYPNPKDLLSILKFFEQGDNRNPDVFNKIRKELDWIMDYCYKCGLLLKEYKGSELGECSKFLGQDCLRGFVPLHVQRSFHSTTSLCNDGSHRLELNGMVREGKAPYVISTTILELLNIIYWLKGLPTTEEGRSLYRAEIEKVCSPQSSNSENRRDQSQSIDDISKYIGHEFLVEEDENHALHCGSCCLHKGKAISYVGKRVILRDVKIFESKDGRPSKYQFFSQKFDLVQ